MMKSFAGFRESGSFTELPDAFFSELLTSITDPDELKVVLYALWRLAHLEGKYRMLPEAEFDPQALGLKASDVQSGLAKAEQRGILLRSPKGKDAVYFLNSPRGRAAQQALLEGHSPGSPNMSSSPLERTNAFKLYEENIGPLTPLIADALTDAEAAFSSEWLADAIELAAKHNKRSWKYCEAILKRWKEEGRGEEQNRRNHQASRQRNVEAKIKKFIGR